MPQTEQEWRKFRNKVQKDVNRANSLLQKLEQNNLENTPSYHTFTTAEGRSRFGIKGLRNDQVNEEWQKVKAFLDNTTSTVKGAKNFVKEASRTMGVSTKDFSLVYPNFWKIADALRATLEGSKASYLALDSDRVVDTVREVLERHYQGVTEIENLAESIDSAIDILEQNLPNAVERDTANYLKEVAAEVVPEQLTLNMRR